MQAAISIFLLVLLQVISIACTNPQKHSSDRTRTRLIVTMLDNIDKLINYRVPLTVSMGESGWQAVKSQGHFALPLNIRPALMDNGLEFDQLMATLKNLCFQTVVSYGNTYSKEQLAAFEQEGVSVISGMFGPGTEGDSKTNTITHFLNFHDLSYLQIIVGKLEANGAYFI